MRLYSSDSVVTPLKTRNLVLLITVAIGIIVFASWAWITRPAIVVYITIGWLGLVTLLLWWGNRFLSSTLDRFLPWNRSGNIRFFLHLVLGISFLLLLVNISYVVLKVTLTTDPPTREQITVMNFYGALIFIPIFSIYFSLHFLKHWRKSELEAEKSQKETMRSQLESLKNHLDPHFLFNNLNILSALVDKDPQRSKVFIDKFAEVYRSILRTRAEDLIPLSEELEFIQSYIHLINTRFGNNIRFTFNLKNDHHQRMIPPLTLQMLMENAIKHNPIQEGTPLAIQLLQLETDYLIVSNTLLPSQSKQETLGSGLQNIQKRYAHFTDKPVKIVKTETHFEVHIPLLEIEHL